MAARVGTGVIGSGDGSSTTIASAAQNTTTGNLLVAIVKNEGVSITVSSLADTAGNTWVVAEQGTHSGNNPTTSLCYAANITGNAANVVTATFSATTTFRQISVEEWSGLALSSVLDGAATEAEGADNTFTTGDITTTTSGLVVIGVGATTALTAHSGTLGNPDFSIANTGADACFMAYLISGSAQTVSPGASNTSTSDWYAVSQAFKDAAVVAPGIKGPRLGQWGRDQGYFYNRPGRV